MHSSPLLDLLLEEGHLDDLGAGRACARQSDYQTALVEHLVDLELIDETQLATRLHECTQLPLLSALDPNPMYAQALSIQVAQQHRAVIEGKREQTWLIAMADPLDAEAQRALQDSLQAPIEVKIAPLSVIRGATAKLYYPRPEARKGPLQSAAFDEAALRWGLERAEQTFKKLGRRGEDHEIRAQSQGPLFWIRSQFMRRRPAPSPTMASFCNTKAISLKPGLDGLTRLLEDARLPPRNIAPIIKTLGRLSGYGSFVVDNEASLRYALPKGSELGSEWHPPQMENGALVFYYLQKANYCRVRILEDQTLQVESLGPGVKPPPRRGRPYVDDRDRALAPPVIVSAPSELRSDARKAARAWRQEARFELASVASFSRVSLELMAHGAPLSLLRGVHQAALDELQHAQLCMELAKKLDRAQARLGAVPALAPRQQDLQQLALCTLQEAYLPESCAVAEAERALELARWPQAKEVLAVIIADERAHRDLALEILRWCVKRGGSPVLEALLGAVEPEVEECGVEIGGPLQEFGLLDDRSKLSIASKTSALRRSALPALLHAAL